MATKISGDLIEVIGSTSNTTIDALGIDGPDGSLILKTGGATSVTLFASGSASLEGNFTTDEPIFINEQGSPNSDSAGHGQIWVKNDAPNTLQFTNDGGTDIPISQGVAKVWWRSTGAYTTFIQSFNCTSVTDSGTGDHTINLTNDLDSTGYSATATGVAGSPTDKIAVCSQNAAGTIDVGMYDASAAAANDTNSAGLMHGDLA